MGTVTAMPTNNNINNANNIRNRRDWFDGAWNDIKHDADDATHDVENAAVGLVHTGEGIVTAPVHLAQGAYDGVAGIWDKKDRAEALHRLDQAADPVKDVYSVGKSVVKTAVDIPVDTYKTVKNEGEAMDDAVHGKWKKAGSAFYGSFKDTVKTFGAEVQTVANVGTDGEVGAIGTAAKDAAEKAAEDAAKKAAEEAAAKDIAKNIAEKDAKAAAKKAAFKAGVKTAFKETKNYLTGVKVDELKGGDVDIDNVDGLTNKNLLESKLKEMKNQDTDGLSTSKKLENKALQLKIENRLKELKGPGLKQQLKDTTTKIKSVFSQSEKDELKGETEDAAEKKGFIRTHAEKYVDSKLHPKGKFAGILKTTTLAMGDAEIGFKTGIKTGEKKSSSVCQVNADVVTGVTTSECQKCLTGYAYWPCNTKYCSTGCYNKN